jgi:hypothetical protein
MGRWTGATASVFDLSPSRTTSRRSALATIGSGASRSQVLTSLLKCFETPRASRLLATHMLVEVGDTGLGGGGRGDGGFTGRSLGGRWRYGDWLGRGLDDRLGGKEAPDAVGCISATFVEREVMVEAEVATGGRLIGHGAPRSEAFWDHTDGWSNASSAGVSWRHDQASLPLLTSLVLRMWRPGSQNVAQLRIKAGR